MHFGCPCMHGGAQLTHRFQTRAFIFLLQSILEGILAGLSSLHKDRNAFYNKFSSPNTTQGSFCLTMRCNSSDFTLATGTEEGILFSAGR